MEVCSSKGGRIVAPASILAMLMTIMMLLNAYCCGASILAKSNTSFRCSDSRLDECLIEEYLELELGFLMNPYVSRILADSDPTPPPNPSNPEKPAFDTKTCGQPNSDNPQYASCIEKYKGKPGACVRRGVFQRSC